MPVPLQPAANPRSVPLHGCDGVFCLPQRAVKVASLSDEAKDAARETYRTAATDSSVPASFCDSQIGMIDSTMSAAATTLTTGAWLGRKRFW